MQTHLVLALLAIGTLGRIGLGLAAPMAIHAVVSMFASVTLPRGRPTGDSVA